MGKINLALAAALIVGISNVGLTSFASAVVSEGKERAAQIQASPALSVLRHNFVRLPG